MARGISGIKKSKALDIIHERIIEDTRDYWDGYEKPLQYNKLRMRISGLLSQFEINLLDEVRELGRLGKVKLLMSEKLSRFVIPGLAWETMDGQGRLEVMAYINKSSAKKKVPIGNLRQKITKKKPAQELPAGNFFGGNNG